MKVHHKAKKRKGKRSVKGNMRAHHRQKGLLKVKCESTSQSKKVKSTFLKQIKLIVKC